MATAVDAALAEITTTLAAIAPAHEGLRDYASLNLKRETQAEVRVSLQQYDRRVTLLKAAKAALEVVVTDGHPDLTPRKIADAALQDIQENLATITAARQLFVTDAATTLNLSAGAKEPK